MKKTCQNGKHKIWGHMRPKWNIYAEVLFQKGILIGGFFISNYSINSNTYQISFLITALEFQAKLHKRGCGWIVSVQSDKRGRFGLTVPPTGGAFTWEKNLNLKFMLVLNGTFFWILVCHCVTCIAINYWIVVNL